MGCDGGTIPTRDELVKTKKKPEKVDKDAENAAKWKYCALTGQELKEPIVTCELGRLYNKDAILEHLLNKSSNEKVAHIRNLKDVKQLNLTLNTAYKRPENEKGDDYIDVQSSIYICPVVGLEMTGKYKFCVIWTCGCVLSERALKQIKTDNCHKCGNTFKQEDIIVLHGEKEDLERAQIGMNDRREKARSEKKRSRADRKAKAVEAESEPSTSGVPIKKVKFNEKNLTNGTKPSSAAVVSTTVLSDGSKLVGKEQVKTTTSEAERKMRADYSVAKDPTASETYKSLFTTHKTHKNQQKAHWVTFNPQYF